MKKKVQILLVEDNEGDIILAQEALKRAKMSNEVIVARDGEEALEYLNRKQLNKEGRLPDLILLDINLPKVDGKEVLTAIKNDPKLKIIPVVMLTTSASEKDVLDAYSNHANCFITKPSELDKFLHIVHKIENFWLSIVKLPSEASI